MSALRADWGDAAATLDAGVATVSSLRTGGVSAGPYASLNLGEHVGDARACVAENRARFARLAGLPEAPRWLTQVHGARAIDAGDWMPGVEADAIVARRPGVVCAVLTADCLPVLLADRRARVVGAAHAGWRGLAAGVLEATVRRMGVDPAGVCAWLGPAIGQTAFEVGAEVREAFLVDPAQASFFASNARGRWQADLYGLARRRLEACGVTAVTGGGWCTHADPARFFSHRRAAPCGRQATAIWLV